VEEAQDFFGFWDEDRVEDMSFFYLLLRCDTPKLEIPMKRVNFNEYKPSIWRQPLPKEPGASSYLVWRLYTRDLNKRSTGNMTGAIGNPIQLSSTVHLRGIEPAVSQPPISKRHAWE
jgi:hypothetical protein